MSNDGTQLKYPRLNLNITAHNKALDPHTLLRIPREINQFWYDLTILTVRFIQLSGIIWLLGLYYLWPSSWLQAVSWTALFNLDFFIFFEYHKISYFSPVAHHIIVIVGPWVAAITLFIVFKLLPRDPKSGLLLTAPRRFLSFCAAVNDIFYIPVALAFWRCLICGPPRFAPIYSASSDCSDTGYYVQIIVAVVLGLPYLFLVPFFFNRWLKQHVIYSNHFDHLFYVEARESEYLLGLSDLYESHHMYLFSSFHRPYVFHKLWYHAIFFVICGFTTVFTPMVSTEPSGMIVNAVATCIFMLVPLAARLYSPMYRVAVCNHVANATDVALFALNLLSIITSDAPSAPIVAGDQLLVPLFVFFFLGLGLWLWLWLKAIFTHVPWSVGEADILDTVVLHSSLLSSLHTAQTLLDQSVFTPAEVFPAHRVSTLTRTMQHYAQMLAARLAAQRSGKPRPRMHFTRAELGIAPRVAQRLLKQHYDVGVRLLFCVEDTIGDLAHLHGALRKIRTTMQYRGGKDGKGGVAVDPSACLRGFGKSVRQKSFDRALMRPEKHMFLRKLLVARNFLGDEFIRNTENPARTLHTAALKDAFASFTKLPVRAQEGSTSPHSHGDVGEEERPMLGKARSLNSQVRDGEEDTGLLSGVESVKLGVAELNLQIPSSGLASGSISTVAGVMKFDQLMVPVGNSDSDDDEYFDDHEDDGELYGEGQHYRAGGSDDVEMVPMLHQGAAARTQGEEEEEDADEDEEALRPLNTTTPLPTTVSASTVTPGMPMPMPVASVALYDDDDDDEDDDDDDEEEEEEEDEDEEE